MKQYFTELEAAEAAGVSLDTIKEFITLGVLKLNPADAAYSQNYLTHADLVGTFNSLKDLGVTIEVPQPEVEVPKAEIWSTNSDSGNSADVKPTEADQELTEQAEIAPPPTVSLDHDHGNTTVDQSNTFIEHRSFELLDLNKSLKDQIEILKQERDWLRQRVEKLEIRSERDQLLLMSETKNVQTLLPNHTGRKSFWSFLPWNQS